MALVSEGFKRCIHQVHGAQSVMKTGVQCSGIYQVGHAQLFNITQPLKVWMGYKVKDQFGWDTDKTVNRVVNYFLFIQCRF